MNFIQFLPLQPKENLPAPSQQFAASASSEGAADFSPRRQPWVRCPIPVFQPSPGGRGGTAKRWVRALCSPGSRPGLKSSAPRGASEPHLRHRKQVASDRAFLSVGLLKQDKPTLNQDGD